MLRTLGRLSLPGTALTRPKPLLLLAYLALEGPATREDLVEVFFGGERGGPASLRSTLGRVRRALPGALVTEAGRVETGVPCDAALFLGSLDGGDVAGGAAAYAGAFVQGAQVRGWTPELEGWVYGVRERLGERQRRALLSLALDAARRAEFGMAAGLAVRAAALREAPDLTPGQARLLRRLLSAGDAALPVELRGLDGPDPAGARRELLELAWQPDGEHHGSGGSGPGTLRGAVLPGPGLPAVAPPVPALPASALPASAPGGVGFVGRVAELGVLLRTLDMPDAQLVVIVGPGGIGKTRLAREVTRTFTRPGGAAFLTVEPDWTPAQLPGVLARALGRPEPQEPDPVQALAGLLGGREALLVLDSAELLTGGLAWLGTLLRRCPDVKVLVTSRERVPLDEAWTLHLRGLTLPPDRAGREQVRASEAAQLFVARATRQRLDLPVEGEWRVIARICALVGGSPLGLELAAAWARLWPLERIEQTLTESLDALTDAPDGSGAGRPARHHSVRAVFEQSWSRLGAADRASLARLSVFSGSGSPDAAQVVTGQDWAGLARLVDASLLELTPGGRYRLHPLIQQFAAEQLSRDPQASADAAARRRALTLAFTERAGEALRGLEDEAGWVERTFQEFGNLRQSVTEWLALGEPEPAARSLNALRPFWSRGPALRELLGWYRQVLRVPDALPVPVRGLTFLCAGQIAMNLALHGEAHGFLQAALETDAQRRPPSPLIHLMLGTNLTRQGQLDAARPHYLAAHDAFRAAGTWNGVASSLNSLAYVQRRQGDLGGAAMTLADALDAKRRAGGDEESVLLNLAAVHHDLREFARARALYVQALQGTVRRQFLNQIAPALAGLGRLALDEGRPVLAAQLLAAADAQDDRTDSVRSDEDRRERDGLIRRARAALGGPEDAAFTAAWAQGQAWTPEDALRAVTGA
ncbi:hypothetical protein GCM10008959_20180 [Deinococcus seoulensis]|uniref:ORC1/DEAH AAA+ ATPase domain-containing protein n=1 Tax=Deinococcus seoulensis TaxID=1837379 RepID=A0ABQ2RVE6_9DEIO|nr:tetratricopeptide repeat protein [Deinococcus seoulensis]GGR58479.1 hypothetical protein GCM10008959_20180 [Deinococcus seoulensis]